MSEKITPVAIETFSGRMIQIDNPKPEDIVFEDIVSGLSKCCRFAGQCNRFYSVAEHSVLVHDLVRSQDNYKHVPGLLVEALLHDAHEAYIGDVTAPLCAVFGETYRRVQRLWDRAIWAAFDLPGTTPSKHAAIREADLEAVMLEAYYMLPSRGESWVWRQHDGQIPPSISWYGGLDHQTAAMRFAMTARRYGLDTPEAEKPHPDPSESKSA